MTTPVNPVDVETAIRETSDRIARGVRVCTERYKAYLDAKSAHDKAFARAFMDHDGPQTEKRHVAVLATETEREARDVANAAYKYAMWQAEALSEELRAWQSVNKTVALMYGAAGTGER